MGWWQIPSSSGTPHYVGDDPWNVIEGTMEEVGELLAGHPRLSDSEARLLVGGKIPPRFVSRKQVADGLTDAIAEMWAVLDECYWETWDRGPLPEEKEALAEKALGWLMLPTELTADDLDELNTSGPENVRSQLRAFREGFESGHWLRVEDGGYLIDLTSVSEFDEWVARRYPNVEPGAASDGGA